MTEVKITTLCDHCGIELPENFLPNESCPNCGHKGRTSHIDITENINISKEERLDLYALKELLKFLKAVGKKKSSRNGALIYLNIRTAKIDLFTVNEYLTERIIVIKK